MTPAEALAAVRDVMPGDVTPVEGNPNLMGWHLFTVFFRGLTTYAQVDTEGNVWEQEEKEGVEV